jgi:hypothetical protein
LQPRLDAAPANLRGTLAVLLRCWTTSKQLAAGNWQRAEKKNQRETR